MLRLLLVGLLIGATAIGQTPPVQWTARACGDMTCVLDLLNSLPVARAHEAKIAIDNPRPLTTIFYVWYRR